jgi:hypothetical protein
MEKENLGFADTGGASGSALSVPQLAAVFSYSAEGGDILVYLAKVGFSKLAIITFDDNHREFAYAIQTLVSCPVKEAYQMVEDAEKEFSNPFISNPFTKLLHDDEAMSRLIRIFRKFLDEGE